MRTAMPTITDLSKWAPPQRRILDDDGNVTIEKLCPVQHLQMVDLAGNVGPLPLSNGIANRDPNDPYAIQLLAEKVAGGMVQVAKCPLGVSESIPHLPKAVRFKAGPDGKPDEKSSRAMCRQGANGGPISTKNPCECIALLIAARRARHEKLEAVKEERINRLAKLQERTAQANLDATSQLAEAAKALAAAANPSRKDGK